MMSESHGRRNSNPPKFTTVWTILSGAFVTEADLRQYM